MDAASALSGWLRFTTSLAAPSVRDLPGGDGAKATTSTHDRTDDPQRPGSVVAAARSCSGLGQPRWCRIAAPRPGPRLRVSGSRTFGGFATLTSPSVAA